ncbi:unnamed protein product [Leptidea sinapis]|uniref:Uncharacterized protein n=1 Tax=Leptidea sinapis TaxID=189913 RepID=A0A5E4Q1U6_9NEOP|nr:unnamed protein product [Leptidea sinapis]
MLSRSRIIVHSSVSDLLVSEHLQDAVFLMYYVFDNYVQRLSINQSRIIQKV